MTDRKPEKEERPDGPAKADAEADVGIDLDAIDRVLKGGLEAIPVERISRDSLQPQVVTRLDAAPEEAKPSEAEPAPEASAQKPAAELAPGPATLTFHEEFGDMEVRISPDRMTASLAAFEPRRQDISVEEVVAALEANRIVFGIDERAVGSVLRAVAKRGKAPPDVIIARGIPVVEGQDARFLLDCLEDKPEEVGSAPELTEEVLAEIEKVRQAFQGGIEPLQKEPLRAIRVNPGECILRKLPPEEGTKGTSVFGVEGLPGSGKDVTLKAGPNVGLSDDKLCYNAEAFGYVVLYSGQVSVHPPILLSKDKMTACFVNLPPFGPPRPISEVHLREAVARMGIQHGIDEQTITRLCAGEIDRRVVVIARGAAPVNGLDGQTHLEVEVAAQPGKILEDGTIDFRERNVVANVSAEALIAVYTKATKGAPGTAVTGEPVTAADGKDVRPNAGENVRVQEDAETVQFFATTIGHVRFSDNKVSVRAGFQVSGDVDYKTGGNVDFVGDVVVAGTVTSGFTVKAGGSVTVGGSMEMGARVEAGEDVVVSYGIAGPTASVKAGGDVFAKFIANATVEAEGDVVVGGYIHNAVVRAGGHIRVHGRGRLKKETSAVVGGSLMAMESVHVASAGSTFDTQTRLIAGVDPRYLEQMQKLKTGIEFCDTNSVRIFRVLRIPALTPENLRRVLQNVSPEKKRAFMQLVLKLQELAKLRQKFLDEQEQLQGRQDEVLQRAVIRVDGIVFHGVRAQIGAVATLVLRPIEGVNFRLDVKDRKVVSYPLLESTG
jgi:uncharacterized protein (DUF342 family)